MYPIFNKQGTVLLLLRKRENRSTKPLSYAGTLIEGIEVTFKDGKIVDVSAGKGDETMKKLFFDNEGGTGLGEVALVPDPSPISQSGITFFTILFDENASNKELRDLLSNLEGDRREG